MNLKKVYIVLMLLTAAALPVCAADTPNMLKTEFQDIPPKFLINSDGSFSGLSYDLMKMIERNSDIRFSYSADVIPLSRVTFDISKGAIDVQVGIQKTPEREKLMIFGEPLYKVKTVAVVRADDDFSCRTLADIAALGPDDGRILTVWGTGIAQILKSMPGLSVEDGARTPDAAIKKLIAGRGRVLIYHNLTINYLMKNPAFAGKIKIVPLDFRGTGLNDTWQYIAFSKTVSPDLIRKINRVIVEARTRGELDRISRQYLE